MQNPSSRALYTVIRKNIACETRAGLPDERTRASSHLLLGSQLLYERLVDCEKRCLARTDGRVQRSQVAILGLADEA